MLELNKMNHGEDNISKALGISKEDFDKAFMFMEESESASKRTSEFVERVVTVAENNDQLVAVIAHLHVNLVNAKGPQMPSSLMELLEGRSGEGGEDGPDCEGCPAADECPDYKPKE